MNLHGTLNVGQQLKLAGQGAALANAGAGSDWKGDALFALRLFLSLKGDDDTFAMEDFRRWAIDGRYLAEPAHHNAWGAIPRVAAAQGMCVWTGDFRPAASAKTHGHPVRLYRKGRA